MIRALAIVVVLGAAGLAHADPEEDMRDLRNMLEAGWYGTSDGWVVAGADVHGNYDPPRCKKYVDLLASSPGTLKVKFNRATADFPEGEHTLAEMRLSCDHLTRLARVMGVDQMAQLAMKASPKLDGNDYDVAIFSSCVEAYANALKVGMSPTELVPESKLEDPKTHQPLVWKGTIESIVKTWCEPGFKKAQEKIAKREAPYRAVLKNDKLEMALEAPYFYLVGGRGTDKPADLAAANVWFRDSTPDSGCNGGTPHVLSRFQFDGAGKLVKSTSKTYCGSVPGSAYR